MTGGLRFQERADRYSRQNGPGRPLTRRQWRRIDKKIDHHFYSSLRLTAGG
jgi:hypothetical protein